MTKIERIIKKMEVNGLNQIPLSKHILKKLNEDISIAASSGGGGGGASFSELPNKYITTINLADATEGATIPDGATTRFTKTIDLGAAYNKVLLRMLNYGGFTSGVTFTGGKNFGVAQSPFTSAMNSESNAESGATVVVTTDYTTAERHNVFTNGDPATTTFCEKTSTGDAVLSSTNPSVLYSDNNCILGFYNGTGNVAYGYTSTTALAAQGEFHIESFYLDGNNLICLCKKHKATTSVSITNLKFNAYDLS